MSTDREGEKKGTGPLIEGRDYYLENGFFVLTEAFLRRRGYCCQSGCRHCPYGYSKGGTPSGKSRPGSDQAG